ncbi:AAA family ATPase [Streptomyces sp. NPDC093252]|uniref:AAA family ATPase n=1 Tax=Streptomyces sp. NPDC093252 TaxID=3154980 RepID=UPI00341E048E
MERLEAALPLRSGHPLLVLHGDGTDDHFVTGDYQYRSLREALLLLLKRAGFERVVFSSTREPVYFLDRQSLDIPPPGAAPAAPPPTTGPLGSRRRRRSGGDTVPGATTPADSAAGTPPRHTMTDAAAVQTLNSYMHRTDVRTAVVFELVEDLLAHHAAARDLAGSIGEWLSGGAGRNLCVLVFSANSRDEVVDAVRHRGGPAVLADYIDRRGQDDGPDTESVVHSIGPPGRAELRRLVKYVQLGRGVAVPHWSEVDALVNRMAAQRTKAAAWVERLSREGRLDAALLDDLYGVSDDRPALEQLDDLIGLDGVKEFIHRFTATMLTNRQLRAEGRPTEEPPHHLVFRGNPGTGKTTVARLLARHLQEIGLLESGHLVEGSPGRLVGQYVGHTRKLTNDIVNRALDGVLFIDEAYALTRSEAGGFGQEAVDTLVPRLSDDHDRLVVIVAGYGREMDTFLAANEGLRRRFSKENDLTFADYSAPQLHRILMKRLAGHGHDVPALFGDRLLQVVTRVHETRDPRRFGNAGEMENIAGALHSRWSGRVAREAREHGTERDVGTRLTDEDIPPEYLEP